MDTNDSTRIQTPAAIIELGVASIETKGGPLAGEDIGGLNVPGISEE